MFDRSDRRCLYMLEEIQCLGARSVKAWPEPTDDEEEAAPAQEVLQRPRYPAAAAATQ